MDRIGAEESTPFRKDPRRDACPCFVAGAASWLAVPSADHRAVQGLRRRISAAAPHERFNLILGFLDLKVGELSV